MTAADAAWSRHSRMIATAWFRPIILSCALTLGTSGTGAAGLSSEQASQAGRDVVRARVLPPADVNRLSQAAEHGDAAAMNDLGELYANGRGVPKDVARAFQWFQKAAEHGLAKAEFNEGEAYARGDGVLPDSAQAFQWYCKAAIQGLPEAQFAVAKAYAESNGVGGDDVLAYQWYLKAAQQGYALAQLEVGEAFVLGKGVAQSDERAFPWLRQAAEQGLARAQYMFGMRHPRSSLSDDIAVAAEWFRKAAEQDYAPAQYMLGTLQRSNSEDTLIVADETKTIVKDFVGADRWFTICWKRAFGEIAARCRTSIDEIERHMSPDDVFESQTRALEWMQAYDSRQQ